MLKNTCNICLTDWTKKSPNSQIKLQVKSLITDLQTDLFAKNVKIINLLMKGQTYGNSQFLHHLSKILMHFLKMLPIYKMKIWEKQKHAKSQNIIWSLKIVWIFFKLVTVFQSNVQNAIKILNLFLIITLNQHQSISLQWQIDLFLKIGYPKNLMHWLRFLSNLISQIFC